MGVVSRNSGICPILLKPAPKDAGAAPASFGPAAALAVAFYSGLTFLWERAQSGRGMMKNDGILCRFPE